MQTPEFTESADGYELQFATNHLGHFLLTDLLKGRLAEDARIVNLSSLAHKWAKFDFNKNMPPNREHYNAKTNYGISKACNVLFTRQLQKDFSSSGSSKTAYSVHPGVIPSTELFKNMPIFAYFGKTVLSPFFKDIPQGAATTLYCAIHPDALKHAGEYFLDCHVQNSSNDTRNPEYAEKLWKISQDLVNSSLSEK
jgi:NAD(P)-dependent dehydrogenase (short-subunit alcohol dehydrogenase family)